MGKHIGKLGSALVFANPRKKDAIALAGEVKNFLSGNGVNLTSKKPSLIITIGGDGTVLYNKERYGVPFFSIGSKTSFICQADFSDWRDKLGRLVKGFTLEKRLLLRAEVDGRKLPLALNEVGIRNPAPRVLSIHLMVGKRHFAFRSDGMLFSTPTGSPAYCYSCGGRQMPRGEWKYQAVGICPFRRLFKPTIVGERTSCILRFSGPEQAQLFIDGQVFGSMTGRNTLKVSVSRKAFLFAKV